MKVLAKLGMFILLAGLLSSNISYGQYTEESNADLGKQNQGSFVLTVSEPDAKIFILPYESDIIHSHEELLKIRDVILETSPIDTTKESVVKAGKYLIAIKYVVPRDSDLIRELGSAAPDNLLIPSSKTGGYKMVIGSGPTEGCIFKKIDDVGLEYEGALFATGEPKKNEELTKKYDYLKTEGVKELMFRFSEGESTMELWLLTEAILKPGSVWKENFQVSPK
jgi:hypothetical protein